MHWKFIWFTFYFKLFVKNKRTHVNTKTHTHQCSRINVLTKLDLCGNITGQQISMGFIYKSSKAPCLNANHFKRVSKPFNVWVQVRIHLSVLLKRLDVIFALKNSLAVTVKFQAAKAELYLSLKIFICLIKVIWYKMDRIYSQNFIVLLDLRPWHPLKVHCMKFSCL